MHRYFSIVVLGCVAALAGCAGGGSAAGEPEYEEGSIIHEATAQDRAAVDRKEPIEGDGALLYVNGLGCPLCATNLEPQLKRVRGVNNVAIDLGAGTARVNLEPGAARPSPARLKKAVEDAGFTLVKIETL